MMVHELPVSVCNVEAPRQFTYPFCYEAHPLCVAAAGEVRRYLHTRTEWAEELSCGKMLGVLVVQDGSKRGFLAAFSGTLDGKTRHSYFVPPVFDLMEPGCHFQIEQEHITAINHRIAELQSQMRPSPLREEMESVLVAFRAKMKNDKEARRQLRSMLSPDELQQRETELLRESQFQKAEYKRMQKAWMQRVEKDEEDLRLQQDKVIQLQQERKSRSIALQHWLFGQFSFANANGVRTSLLDVFRSFAPPSGAGECCAPRLLQYAYLHHLKPLCMAEFWVGQSPKDEVRRDGDFYPACNSRCKPILRHMLQGLNVEPDPLSQSNEDLLRQVRIVYRDEDMAVVSKPSGLLSVPGKEDVPSLYSTMKSMFPAATGPMIVHRLDMDTSGLMVVALTEASYHRLQDLFLHRKVHKVYHALLERPMAIGDEGNIHLPLRPDIDDRPRQLVDYEYGKEAHTHYRVIGEKDGHAVLELQPLSGRTHQLRVHCAHCDGLNNPIVGDRLYGTPARRLMLHASRLQIADRCFTDESGFLLPEEKER